MATQIPYPIVPTDARRALTFASVVAFTTACTAHAAVTRGGRWAASYLGTTIFVGLTAEAVGVRTGWPFGTYSYSGSLGPGVAGVPAVVPLAWAMMAYPALTLAQHIVAQHIVVHDDARRYPRMAGTALAGGLLLTGWDLFLDPQMAAEGHWVWAQPGPSLNGIPLTNAAGWLLVGTILTGLLAALPARCGRRGHPPPSSPPHNPPPGDDTAASSCVPDDRLPFVLLGWTYFSSVLANLAFFGRPAVALAGGLGMGAVLACGVLRTALTRGWRGVRKDQESA